MTVYILGAGPAGMAIAHGLAGVSDFVMIERSGALGGLARTVDWPGVGKHDLGPHKLFTLDQQLMARVEALLGEADWITQKKTSSIYMNGHFLPYPPSPFSLARVFGIRSFAGMIAGYLQAKLKSIASSPAPQTFEEDLKSRIGAELYLVLFDPIARKLWGDPKNLDVKLSRGRIQTPSLLEIIARVLGLRKSSAFEALTFRYPIGGVGRLWDSIHAQTAGSQGRFVSGQTVVGIDIERDRCTAIRCEDERGAIIPYPIAPEDFVVSTLPLTLTTRLAAAYLPDRTVKKAAEILALNDLILVFLNLDCPSLTDKSWIFVPDPAIIFHRMSEQKSFDPSMTPNGTIVCCEIMSNETRDLTRLTDNELIGRAKLGLSQMGYTDFKILNERVIRLPRSYPVFRPGFEAGLEEILTELDNVQNLRTVGRQGAFNYIGTLDAMDIGYGFARWLADRRLPWKAERQRTSHYPVLD